MRFSRVLLVWSYRNVTTVKLIIGFPFVLLIGSLTVPSSSSVQMCPFKQSEETSVTMSSISWRQTEANRSAEIFAPGVISTGHEFSVTFTPDMKEVYFTRNFPEQKINHIMRSRFTNGEWEEPRRISFSDDKWSDLDPALTPDGRRLIFVSTRPSRTAPNVRNMDIWYSERIAHDWKEPQIVENVNSPAKEGSPTVARDETLCFFSDRAREANNNSIYCSVLHAGKYGPPQKLGPEINSNYSDTSPYLTPDGKKLFFYSTRPGGSGGADLYVTVKSHARWSPARNLGLTVNTAAWEYNPMISPNGKFLYFGRERNIYRIPIKLLRASAPMDGRGSASR